MAVAAENQLGAGDFSPTVMDQTQEGGKVVELSKLHVHSTPTVCANGD